MADETIWRRIAKQCMVFRRGYLAPSGGWLASLVIPICQMTGIYDFTILGALYTYLFIFFRSASCEAAMVVGLGFDVTIPAQYYNCGLHPKELAAYWPKLMMATVAEFGCYILLDDADLFNMIVFAKTSITFYLWMSTKKQWPLVFPPGKGPRGGPTAKATATESSAKGKNPLVPGEYLSSYLPNKLVNQLSDPAKKAEYERVIQNVQRPMEDPKYASAMGKLKKLGIKTPEEYAKAYPKGVAGPGSTAAVGPTYTVDGQGKPQSAAAAGTAVTLPQQSSDYLVAVTESPGNGWSSDPRSTQKLSKQEYSRIMNEIQNLINKGWSVNQKMKADLSKDFQLEIGAIKFQVQARSLMGIAPECNIPLIEWVPPPEQEVQALLEDCKRRLERDTDEIREAMLTEVNLNNIKEAIARGPYEAPNWQQVLHWCKFNREADCPEWLDPLPRFIDGYKIPWETQLEIIPQIIASSAPDNHKRGFVYALNEYYDDFEQYIANMKEIDSETGLKLADAKIYEKSRYLPHFLQHPHPDVGAILVSASHFKEAKWRARLDESTMQFQAIVDNLGTAKQAEPLHIFTEFNTGDWAARIEHYTDYHPGTRGLDFSYLRTLRRMWSYDPKAGTLDVGMVDLVLYVIKNNLTSDPEGLVQRAEAARHPNSTTKDAFLLELEQYRKYDYGDRETVFVMKRCALLEDQWRGASGIGTKRTHPGDKYW